MGHRARFVMLGLCCSMAACGSKSSSSDAAGVTDVTWPKQDMSTDKDATWPGMGLGDKQNLSSANGTKNVIWLNFGGGTVTADQSFIVKKANLATLTIPAFASADLGASFASNDRATLMKTIVDEVKKEYVGVNVNIVTDQPMVEHETVYIGGTNFTGTADVLGISPLDVGNFSGTDLIFAFSKEVGSKDVPENTLILSHTIAHEVAHSLGARHIASDAAIMNPTVYVKTDKFDVEGPVSGGTGNENSIKILQMNVGKTDTTADSKTLPVLTGLNIEAEGDVCQLSVFNLANFEGNPKINLSSYTYTFDFLGVKVDGHTVRFLVKDTDAHPVTVTVKNGAGDSASYSFSVTKKKN